MPRAGLTEARVVDEAARLADEVGLGRLTLAALSHRLGVRQPSLYKHVAGMDGLQQGIAVQAKRELGDVLAGATVGRSRDGAVAAMARAYRDWALEHPGRYAAAQRAPAVGAADDEEASAAVVAIVAGVLSGFGLRDEEMVDAIRALRSALHGFVSLELEGGFGLPDDVERSYARLIDGLVVALSAWGAGATEAAPGATTGRPARARRRPCP